MRHTLALHIGQLFAALAFAAEPDRGLPDAAKDPKADFELAGNGGDSLIKLNGGQNYS